MVTLADTLICSILKENHALKILNNFGIDLWLAYLLEYLRRLRISYPIITATELTVKDPSNSRS
jgi:hypothetical protein